MSESAEGGSQDGFFVLVKALRAFKTGPLADNPSDRALAREAGVSPTTIADWLRGARFPQDIGTVLIVVRTVGASAAARGVAAPAGLLDEDRWRAAYEDEARRRADVVSDAVRRAQAVSVLAGRPAAVRAGEADLRRLGVHAAISVPGIPDEVPPEYVPRDTDTDEHGVQAKVAAAAARGGFVLLTGGSSVGKTRCAAEAVKAVLPDWWLIHPGGPAEVAALAAAPPPRTVMWLDELQRYLDGEYGLTGGMVRALLNAPGPVVVIATLWPDRYSAYTAVPAPGGPDPRAREREVLELAVVIRIRPRFSAAEQDRARAAAGRDPRLAAAVRAGGYGLTQTLAAAPQLVARWEEAQETDPYAWAVLTAALEAARLGARAPLTAGFLRAAAPGYCTPVQQAKAPVNWFEQALAYATAELHGAATPLTPAGNGMGQVDGYTVADYLLQHASWERRAVRVPASFWDALTAHVRDPHDAARLADNARGRLLYRYAIPLYRCAAGVGDQYAARRLTGLLAAPGDVEELRARADAGDEHATYQLVEVLGDRGDLDGLLARADVGDSNAAIRLIEVLGDWGDLDGLRARADAGDRYAAGRLAEVLIDRGDLDGLRARADAGDERGVMRRLAEVLRDRGDLDGLRARADAGDEYAAYELAEVLGSRGDLDGLRARADAGDAEAAGGLARKLRDRGDLDELRARVDAGDEYAAYGLAEVLGSREDLDELRALADAGAFGAATRLAEVLIDRGDLDELRARADAGDEHAARRLAEVLGSRGDLDELRARADAGDEHAARRLAEVLGSRGDLDELRARADAGDFSAAMWLAEVLARRGNLDQALQILRAGAEAGNGNAPRMARLLTERGHVKEARRLCQYGLNPDGSIASKSSS